MTFQEAANILLCHLDGKRPVKKNRRHLSPGQITQL